MDFTALPLYIGAEPKQHFRLGNVNDLAAHPIRRTKLNRKRRNAMKTAKVSFFVVVLVVLAIVAGCVQQQGAAPAAAPAAAASRDARAVSPPA